MKVRFSIQYHTVWGESLTLDLGGRRLPMNWGADSVWSVEDDVKASELLDYQYYVMRDGLIWRTEWEHHCRKVDGRRRSIAIEDVWIDCPIPGCPFPRRHQAEIFDRPGFRGAGTAVPVFSLRSEEDCGIGDFGDLRALVDWAAATGQCIIQLLPVNDTTRKGGWQDSYPYSPISAFALNPLYIRLQDAGVEETEAFAALRRELNALPAIDYPKVFEAKMGLLREAYARHGKADTARREYKNFCRSNASVWLDEYALFCARRDGFEAQFYRWLQWHLDRQFSAAADYARSRGVHFKGDLPIGISSDSAEAYWHPELFNLDCSAGAPPDYFSKDGQNWGFPTYNWEEMEKDGYAWWKARLRVMSRYFDAFRIDHILGFFRIWEIPSNYRSGTMGYFNPALPYTAEEIADMLLPVEGLFHEDPRHEGCYQPLISPDTSGLEWWQKERFDAVYNDFFYHRHDQFWLRNAEKKLPELLGATGMLACGEDLGMVPGCVSGVMDHEKILTLEMAMMDKGRPWPVLSVCATSSHDMDTLRMQHQEKCGSDLSTGEAYDIVKAHLDSASMLAIFPVQDWIALDEKLRRKDFMEERINYPADPDNKWKYRMHLGVDALMADHSFCEKLRQLIKSSNR